MPESPLSTGIHITRGGPFYELQMRLGLIDEHQFYPWRQAFFFVAIAWGVTFLIVLAEGNAFGPSATNPFIRDGGNWARFFISIGIFIAMETRVESFIQSNLHPLLNPPLLAENEKSRARQALLRANQRGGSTTAELLCLVIAIVWSVMTYFAIMTMNESSWLTRPSGHALSLTWAAIWCLSISVPTFTFLLLRSIWRITTLSLLLTDLSKLDLRLTVTHPDGYAGVGFLGTFPNAYTPFVFALSCVFAAILSEGLDRDLIDASSYTMLVSIWVAIIYVLLGLPMLSFSKVLAALKSNSMKIAGTHATRRELALEREILGENISADVEDGPESSEKIANPKAILDAATNLKVVLFRRSAVLPLLAAALLPLLAAGATTLPISDLTALAKKLLVF